MHQSSLGVQQILIACFNYLQENHPPSTIRNQQLQQEIIMNQESFCLHLF